MGWVISVDLCPHKEFLLPLESEWVFSRVKLDPRARIDWLIFLRQNDLWWVFRSFQPAKEEEKVQQIPVCKPKQTSRGISCQWPWPRTSSPPLPEREETQHRRTFQKVTPHHLLNQLSVFTCEWFLSNGWFFHYETAISLNVTQFFFLSLL